MFYGTFRFAQIGTFIATQNINLTEFESTSKTVMRKGGNEFQWFPLRLVKYALAVSNLNTMNFTTNPKVILSLIF